MAEVRLKDNESLESALRRFKKQCARAGISPASVTKMGRNGHVTTEIL
ncbi:MAG: 30S ribosomal protein S21, partial [Ruminococcaceae bacterium]|nr:30S ribosomal protein S21 [Oscillospiraceae bacterium]